MSRILAAFAAVLATVAIGLLTQPGPGAAEETDLLHVTSNVVYDVKTGDVPVAVTWDISIVNNDPETAFADSGDVLIYESLNLPLLRGASNPAAIDSDGTPLGVSIEDLGGPGVAVRGNVAFARPLFFEDTYDFTLTYEIPETRSREVVVTPYYAFLPVIAAGQDATVVVNTPTGDPWQVSLEPRECTGDGATLSCSGTDLGYLAAIVEVVQVGAAVERTFDVPLEDLTVTVTLSYYQGEEEAAAHDEELITAGLPVIEEVYGFSFDGPATLSISHGGYQEIFGYEGIASCAATCEIVISPIADDYTVLHELAHLWSNIYGKRWLSEGFGELVSREAAAHLPEGLVEGAPPDRTATGADLKLDDWGDVEPVVGADADTLAEVEAGYARSLAFLQEVRTQFGLEALQAVNRNLATGGSPGDSRRFMDLLEDATGQNTDGLFLEWVFPDSYETILADRRNARVRLSDLRQRLVDEELAQDAIPPLEASIRAWDFQQALADLDEIEAGLDTYEDLRSDLARLETEALSVGLTLPESISDDLTRFQFEDVAAQITLGRQAIADYVSAGVAVDAPRGLWQRFGLLGSDPDGELRSAANAFNAGEFERSSTHSLEAEDLIDDASSVATMRMLIVAGFLGLIVLAIVVALAIGHLRERELADG